MNGKMSSNKHLPGLEGRIPEGSMPRCIDKDDLVTLDLERERRLLINNGLLWVTIQNDRRDYLLDGNKEMPLPVKKRIIVEAEEPTCFQID